MDLVISRISAFYCNFLLVLSAFARSHHFSKITYMVVGSWNFLRMYAWLFKTDFGRYDWQLEVGFRVVDFREWSTWEVDWDFIIRANSFFRNLCQIKSYPSDWANIFFLIPCNMVACSCLNLWRKILAVYREACFLSSRTLTSLNVWPDSISKVPTSSFATYFDTFNVGLYDRRHSRYPKA